ncbi:MAG TPA: c-type cytochrome [Pseudomonadales bacterium]|jgi:cytochrome c
MYRFLSAALVVLAAGCGAPQEAAEPSKPTYDDSRVGHFGYGKPASAEEIAGWDIDIRPDGLGLPQGSGSVEDGEWLYEAQCAECHGSFGEGVGRFPVLSGGKGSLTDPRPSKTVGSYWPYTSTLYDYIRRTMPFTQPESLTADETYAVTAYVLYLNDLVEDDFVLTHENLASVRLPNEGNFVPDPRPDVSNTRCMTDCRDPAAISVLSEVPTYVPASMTMEEIAEAEPAHPGAATYDQYCSICHDVGVAGAPRIGDAAAWSSRLERGMAALEMNAINGIASEAGVMPAKGGFAHLADDEVNAAVAYMVEGSQ